MRNWLKEWNNGGYEGLKLKFTGGPKPKISDGEWDRVLEEIENKGMTIKDVMVYVKDTRGILYSYKTVWHILRKKKRVKYGKPYIMNKNRPENAEGIFKKLNEAISNKRDPIIDFIDENSIKMNPNKRRVINTKVVRYSEGKKRSKTIFGFMAISGNDVAMVSDTAKKGDMREFLELIRKENGKAPIIAIMDNLPTHKAKIVRESCEKLDIHQVFLPPYSPDLSTIEFGWKDLKKELSVILDFDEMVKQCKKTKMKVFNERKESYITHCSLVGIIHSGKELIE